MTKKHTTKNKHPNPPGAESQCDMVLRTLQSAGGRFVPLSDLVWRTGAYAIHSRISDLRARGYRIENKTEHDGKHQCRSWYRLKRGGGE